MKVIFSRKGMDSQYGGVPSPILPDGTLLSLPIPEKNSGVSYSDISYKGKRFRNIISELSPRFDFAKDPECHLDPDIYDDINGRAAGWRAAFGQREKAASHLDSREVGAGDIFLFYGTFRKTEYDSNSGALKYVRNAPSLHIIYGYMKVGEILRDEKDIKARCPRHPHAVNSDRPNNRIYLPEAYGTFRYDKELILTKEGQENKSLWSLPAFFADKDISVSWQGKNRPELVNGFAELSTSCQGQEFVVTAAEKLEKELCDWVDLLIRKGMKRGILNDK